jgi:hypothetical protein
MLVTNPWVFFGIGGLIVAYVMYMIVRGRSGGRGSAPEREAEL